MANSKPALSLDVTSRLCRDASLSSPSVETQDTQQLARTGKAPVLKRSFGFTAILGFSLIVIDTWGGSFALLGIGLTNGGPSGLVYTYIIVWMGTLATFTSLAELASMAPTAGGQYHWVSILAPTSARKFLSYITGWLTVCGWLSNVAASSYIIGLLVQGLIQVASPEYEMQLWHATLLAYAVLLVSTFATTVAGTYLPLIESCLLVLYLVGFFAVLVPLIWLGPHSDASAVFNNFFNHGGWSTQGLSLMVGISGNAAAFLGADSVYHMSEEVKNSAKTVPKAMVCSLLINGAVGLSMMIAILFCAGDLEAAYESRYVYPFIEILSQAIRSRGGVAVIMVIIITVNTGLLIGVVAASSRMLWAFARDRGVPYSRYITKVTSESRLPLVSIFLSVFVAILVDLISLGSPVALNDVLSLVVTALYGSYLIACLLLLWRRCTNSIRRYEDMPFEHYLSVNAGHSSANITWGPWKVPEPLGTIINAFACVYLIVIFFFCFWPPATPVTPATMNYSCVVFGFAIIATSFYYVAFAKKTYNGPIIEVS